MLFETTCEDIAEKVHAKLTSMISYKDFVIPIESSFLSSPGLIMEIVFTSFCL